MAPGGGTSLLEANGDVPMGLQFQDWINYHGVAPFLIELLEWGRRFSDFWGKTVPHIYGEQRYQNVCCVGENVVFFIQFRCILK